MKIEIFATGSRLPERVLTNADLEKMVDTTNEWILSRTGIQERRIATPNIATSDLAVAAAQSALGQAGMTGAELDIVIVATVTSDMAFPSTACLVQKEIGATRAFAFDINAACTGYIYALALAKSLLETGTAKTALVIGADLLSRITNWEDRSTCVLFGDGAGATILKKSEHPCSEILSIYLGSDGTYHDILKVPAGGSRQPFSADVLKQRLHFIHMEGGEVFKLAVTKMVEASEKALELCHKKPEDVSLIIPHQANLRIIDAVSKRLSIPSEKVFLNIHKYGNMSAATTPIALDEARREGRVKKGDIVLLVAFGSGLTWGAAVIQC